MFSPRHPQQQSSSTEWVSKSPRSSAGITIHKGTPAQRQQQPCRAAPASPPCRQWKRRAFNRKMRHKRSYTAWEINAISPVRPTAATTAADGAAPGTIQLQAATDPRPRLAEPERALSSGRAEELRDECWPSNTSRWWTRQCHFSDWSGNATTEEAAEGAPADHRREEADAAPVCWCLTTDVGSVELNRPRVSDMWKVTHKTRAPEAAVSTPLSVMQQRQSDVPIIDSMDWLQLALQYRDRENEAEEFSISPYSCSPDEEPGEAMPLLARDEVALRVWRQLHSEAVVEENALLQRCRAAAESQTGGIW